MSQPEVGPTDRSQAQCTDCAQTRPIGGAFCTHCGTRAEPIPIALTGVVVAHQGTSGSHQDQPHGARGAQVPAPPAGDMFEQSTITGTAQVKPQNPWQMSTPRVPAPGLSAALADQLDELSDRATAVAQRTSRTVTDRVAPALKAQTGDRPSEAFIGLGLSIISFLPFLTLLVLPALFFASKAKRQIEVSPTPLRGCDMVRFTRILVIVSVLIPLGFIVVEIMAFGTSMSGLINEVRTTFHVLGAAMGSSQRT